MNKSRFVNLYYQLHFLRGGRAWRQHRSVRRYLLAVTPDTTTGPYLRVWIHVLQCGRLAEDRLEGETDPEIENTIYIYTYQIVENCLKFPFTCSPHRSQLCKEWLQGSPAG